MLTVVLIAITGFIIGMWLCAPRWTLNYTQNAARREDFLFAQDWKVELVTNNLRLPRNGCRPSKETTNYTL